MDRRANTPVFFPKFLPLCCFSREGPVIYFALKLNYAWLYCADINNNSECQGRTVFLLTWLQWDDAHIFIRWCQGCMSVCSPGTENEKKINVFLSFDNFKGQIWFHIILLGFSLHTFKNWYLVFLCFFCLFRFMLLLRVCSNVFVQSYVLFWKVLQKQYVGFSSWRAV